MNKFKMLQEQMIGGKEEGRRRLWDGLQRLSLLNEAWIILGDFNAPFSGMDRSGGNPISAVELTDSLRWLEEAHVVPLRSLGSYFSWTNNQNGPARIYSKIDHVFMNEAWLDLFPHANAVFRWEVVSDHCFCVVNNLPKENLGIKLFRFYNFWADHHNFTEVVRNSWRMPIKATGLRAIYLKTLRLKHRLKSFNQDNIGDIGLSYHTAKENYQEAQLLAQTNPNDFRYQKEVQVAAEAFLVQEKMYHSFLTQRSKINWLRKSDMNTSFFHAYLKKRRAKNGIASFVNDQGNLVDNFSEVVSHFVEHLRGNLGSPSSTTGIINLDCIAMGPKLSVDHQLMLLKPFSYKEIRNALFGIPITKSPGPDGFGSGFFKAVWQDIGGRRWILVCVRNTSYSLLMNGRVQGTHSAVHTLKNALVEFSSATGLSINTDKSHIFFEGVSATERQLIAQEIQLPEGSFPLKYLGVPMRPTKWRHEDCEIILQKIRLRLQSWTSRHLSYAGPMQLIHSVLFGLHNYWMSIFILPQSIVKEVEKLCRSFLWGSFGQRSKLHLASWQKVSLPKAYGGLGFRDGTLWNRAILAKYIWAISEKPDILWVKWINAIYLKGFNFWSSTLKSDCIWYWRKLCHIREKFSYSELQAAGFLGRFQPSKLYNCSLNQQPVGYYPAVWSKLTLPKHRFLLWQMINAQLLTRDNLIRLHIQVPNLMCPVCGSYFESHPHLFFDCCLSKQVLNIMFHWLGFIAWPSEFTSWGVWLARAWHGRHGIMASIMNLLLQLLLTVYGGIEIDVFLMAIRWQLIA
ncbi:uncharacterized protein LOC133799673 [Humulus lupulus]|uniref:uncharacterized protein LOC133799673 n=1 Tax=Humulus lupulus TaxID=3486 RepID=UPI002B4109FC|nr:uncharacterized protein LOC133799673 [Humulus lupulus]